MLAGAINTSIIGANGVLNRVSEDGVMTDWFRAPHRRYGTTHRMINLVVVLQLVAIVGSREVTREGGRAEVHHRDVVTFVLTRLEGELHGKARTEVLRQLRTVNRKP